MISSSVNLDSFISTHCWRKFRGSGHTSIALLPSAAKTAQTWFIIAAVIATVAVGGFSLTLFRKSGATRAGSQL